MTFRWWMPPVFVIGLAVLANLILIATAVRVRPTKVAAHPYAASVHEDERRGELADFSSRGWLLQSVLDGGGATLSLAARRGPAPVSATVELYRPDDDRLDQSIAWADPATALRISLARPGVWEIRLAVRDREGTVLTSNQRVMRP